MSLRLNEADVPSLMEAAEIHEALSQPKVRVRVRVRVSISVSVRVKVRVKIRAWV